MSSTNTWLPLLAGLLAQAPTGTNPFDWYSARFAAALNPGIAPWSKPIFILVGLVSILNLPATLWTIAAKRKYEGGFPLYKMREHGSGGRYVCLNSTNVFLVGHAVTSVVFGVYPFLHLYDYHETGRGWMDLSWASLMWIAPYISILMTSIGVVFGILVAPSPYSSARRSIEGDLVPTRGPLSGLPCWLLNGFVIAAPVALLSTVLPPAILLTKAVKTQELHAIEIWNVINQMAKQYPAVPPISEQVSLLQSLVISQQQTKVSMSRWGPCFGLWTGWCFLAVLFAIPAFVAVYRVTNTRVRLAREQLGFDGHVDSGVMELDEFAMRRRQRSSSSSGDTRKVAALAQARSEHVNLSIQFASAAVLLLIAAVALLFDVIVGWKVHTNPTLLATALLIPMLAYSLQASVALILIIIRVVQGKASASAVSGSTTQGLSRSARSTTHSRQESDSSMVEAKKILFSSQNSRSGHVYVSSLPKDSFPVSPSVIHQISVSQTVEVKEDIDENSIRDMKTSHLYDSDTDLIRSESDSRDM